MTGSQNTSIIDEVEEILRLHPETRNNDGLLFFLWLKKQGIRLVDRTRNNTELYQVLGKLKSVLRYRQFFHRDKLYLPVEEIQKFRVAKEHQTRREFSPRDQSTDQLSQGEIL